MEELINKNTTVDTLGIYREIFTKKIIKAVKDYRNSEKYFRNTIILNKIKVEEEYYPEYGHVFKDVNSFIPGLKTKVEKKIWYNKNSGYYAFHPFIWRDLSLVQKIISIIWFSDGLCEESKRKRLSFVLDYNQIKSVDFVFSKNKKEYILGINPSIIEYEHGNNVMLDILKINLLDDILLHAQYYMSGKKTKKYPVIMLANILQPIKLPEKCNYYILDNNLFKDINENKVLTKIEIKKKIQIVLASNQPIELGKRNVLKEVIKYLEEVEEKFKITHKGWLKDIVDIVDNNDALDELFEDFYAGEIGKNIYNEILKESIEMIEEEHKNAISDKEKMIKAKLAKRNKLYKNSQVLFVQENEQ